MGGVELEKLKAEAKAGIALAQFDLGVLYYEGYIIPKDLKKSAEWTQKAAEQGHADAQHDLSGMYHFGRGVPIDHDEAARWYRLYQANIEGWDELSA